VGGVDAEAVLRHRRLAQLGEQRRGDLGEAPAAFADEMAVVDRSHVVDRRSVAEVGVGDDAELLELLEIAVDGRRVDIWSSGLDRARERLRGRVLGALEEGTNE
jgi:hypothetical protein